MPTSFTTERSILRNVVLGGDVQTTLAETMADADLTYRARPETSGFFQLSQEVESDIQYAGKGTSFATESRVIAKSSSGEIDTRVDDYLAGWLLAMVMGVDTFTAGSGGPPTPPNTHILTWLDNGAPAQVTNVYVEDAPGLKRKWQDMSLSKLVLSGTDKGSIMAKGSFIGTGRYADGAMVTLPDLPTAKYIYGSDCIVSIGPAGAPVSMAPRVLSFEATFDHQNDLFRSLGGGVYAVFPRYGNPMVGLKLVIAIDTSSDVRDWQVNRTALEVSMVINSGTGAKLTLDYPLLYIKDANLTDTNKYVTYTIDLGQEDILKASGEEVCTATVLNTAAEYLTAA
jgi:hypothetical protein